MSSNLFILFSAAYNNHAALSTQTNEFKANVFRKFGLLVIFLPYSNTSGKRSSSNSTGLVNELPFINCRALSLKAYINALPPLSECSANTFESDQSTL